VTVGVFVRVAVRVLVADGPAVVGGWKVATVFVAVAVAVFVRLGVTMEVLVRVGVMVGVLVRDGVTG